MSSVIPFWDKTKKERFREMPTNNPGSYYQDPLYLRMLESFRGYGQGPVADTIRKRLQYPVGPNANPVVAAPFRASNALADLIAIGAQAGAKILGDTKYAFTVTGPQNFERYAEWLHRQLDTPAPTGVGNALAGNPPVAPTAAMPSPAPSEAAPAPAPLPPTPAPLNPGQVPEVLYEDQAESNIPKVDSTVTGNIDFKALGQQLGQTIGDFLNPQKADGNLIPVAQPAAPAPTPAAPFTQGSVQPGVAPTAQIAGAAPSVAPANPAMNPATIPAVDLSTLPPPTTPAGPGFMEMLGGFLANPNTQYAMASMGSALSEPGSPMQRLGETTAGLAQNRIYADALASGKPAPFLNPEAQTAVQKLKLDRENLELQRKLLDVRSKVAQAELERALNPEPVKLQQVDLGNKIGMVDPTTGQIKAEFPVAQGPEVRLTGDGRIAIFDPANPASVQYIGEPKAETSDSIIQKGRLLSQIKNIVDPSLASMTALAGKPTVGSDGKLQFSQVPAPEVLNQLRLQEYIKQAQQMAQTDPANAALLMELIGQFQAGLGGAEQPSGFELDEDAAREFLKGF